MGANGFLDGITASRAHLQHDGWEVKSLMKKNNITPSCRG